jgi:hypothetical protein
VNALEQLSVHHIATLSGAVENPHEAERRREVVKQYHRMVAMGVSIMNDDAKASRSHARRGRPSGVLWP